jgi:predicted transposase/invertase (TIGR01784 family)
MSREEIEAMFSISDLKQTKVYQEALEEGKEEGKEEGREEGIEIGQQQGELRAKLDSIPRLAALGLTAEQIATALDLDIERVREVL